MKKHFFSFLAIFFFCLVSPLTGAADSPFKVEIDPDQSSVKSGMMFLVRARVSNASDGSMDLWCHDCSYDKHWVADVPGVFVQPWTCDTDKLEKMTLEPGDVYEKNLILYISKKDGTGPVTFRLGFIQMLDNGDKMQPVWSDPVTLTVRIPDGAAPGPDDADSASGQTSQDQAPKIEFSETMPEDASVSEEETDPDLANKIP